MHGRKVKTACYSQTSIEAGKWYHIVGKVSIVNTQVVISLWVNGIGSIKINENTMGKIFYNSINQDFDGNIHIGKVGQSGMNYMRGIIQDVIFWDESISDSAIATLCQYYSTVFTSKMVE